MTYFAIMSHTAAPAVVGTLQAAQRLGVTRRTVIRLVHAGRLNATRTGEGTAGFAIAADDVERLAAERKNRR
jgi:excisionase family DNA binding protein